MRAPETEVQNVVVSVAFEGVEFDLEELARAIDGASYDPEAFPGVVYKCESSPASFLIFSSGKANCVGAKSVEEARRAVEELTRKLERLGVKPRPEVRVQNLVATFDFGADVDLGEVASSFENVEYDPEVFPGAVLRLDDPKVTVLLFSSGMGVCAGARSMKDVRRAGEKIVALLRPAAR